MIIKLKGATFSNNINGLLNSWPITFYGRTLVTGTFVSSVSKGSTYNATFNVADKCTIDSVAITRGGTTVSGATISGNTITISVPTTAESGPISITFNGSKENGDDPVIPDVPVDPETPTVTTYYFKDRPDSGYLDGGTVKESTKSSTTDYIDISSKPKIGYFGRMGYISGSTFHAIEFYDANKTYLPSLSVLGDGKEMIRNLDLSESKYANAKYVRASVSQSSFTTEQFNSWYFVVGSFIEKEEDPTLEDITSMFPNLAYLGLDGNNVETTSSAYTTDYVPLSGKNNITYKGRMGNIGLNMAFYDSSKKFISGLETVGNGSFITLNINLSDSKYNNAAYVKASISKGTLDETTWLSSSFKIS